MTDAGWQPIETAPEDQEVLFGGMVYASDAAKANGSRDIWCEGVGRKLKLSKNADWLYTGILGGKPTHWMPTP